MKRALLLSLFVCPFHGHAQPVAARLARSIPVTCIYSKKFQDVFAFNSNQAALVAIKQPVIGLYSERKFMIPDLDLVLLSFVFPQPTANIGMTMNYSGNQFYHQTSVGLCFGKKITDILSLGIQFNYYNERVSAGFKRNAMNVEAGIILHITESIQTGFQLKNPMKIKAAGIALPVVYVAGAGFDCSEKLFITSSIEKQEELPANLTVALHYSFLPELFVNGGVTSAENNFFFGIGLQWKNATLTVNTGYHSYLGFTPSVAIFFPFRKKDEE